MHYTSLAPHENPLPDLSGWSGESAHPVPALQWPVRAALWMEVLLLTPAQGWSAATCTVHCC